MQSYFRWTRGSKTANDANTTDDADGIGSDTESGRDKGSNSSSGADGIVYETEDDDDDDALAPTIRELSLGGDDNDGQVNNEIAKPDSASININDVGNYEHERAGIINIKEIKPASPIFTITSTDAEKTNADCGEIVDDSFPQAKHFFIDSNDDDAITLANQATEILDGFNSEDDHGNIIIHGSHDLDFDAKTIATHRTTETRVYLISSNIRSGTTNKEQQDNTNMRHPHQSIYDILDRNFEQLGDSGSNISRDGRQIGHEDVKLCFAAFVAVFHLPSDPTFIQDNIMNSSTIENNPANQKSINDKDGSVKGKEKSSSDNYNKKEILLRVPLSVAFALWREVLKQLGHTESTESQALSYIRSALVLLGMLNLATMDKDRDDGAASSFGVSSSDNPSKSIDCLVVHDCIHQQYGEYLVWGSPGGSYRSLIEANQRRWNEAVRIESEQTGSNYFSLRMLPIHTMTAHHMQETFDLLKDKTFVRRRIRVLGVMGGAIAHVSDIYELLRCIESCILSGETSLEPIDERGGLLDAYQQMLKHFLHETEELKKCNKDESGSVKLGKAAMLKTALIGNAVHLLGASLGGYGFFNEEVQYYRNALELKTLADNGNIVKSLSASDTLHSMGFSLDNVGKRDEALECYNQALSIRYACLGDDDLRVAETLHNKGALLCEEDKGDEAMECLEEALRIREFHLGEEHESCADTMQWMGNCLRKFGDPADSLDYFKYALSIKRKILGNDDIDVANTLFNTAVLLDDIEKYELSLVAYTEALRIRKLVLGNKNQEVADTLLCMGNVATVLENHQSALAYYNESIETREEAIRDDDPVANESDVKLLFLSNPISLRPDLEVQYKKLNHCFEEALPLTKLIMGTNHPSVCMMLKRMGEVYMKVNDWDNAIGSFQGALRVKTSETTGLENDMQAAELLQKKGEAYLFKNEFVKAKTTFDSAIQILKRISGTMDSMSLASLMCCLGVAFYQLSDFAHAKLLFKECMRIQLELAGDDESCIVYLLCWLGRLHQRVNEPQRALELYLSALQRCKTVKTIDYRVVVHLLQVIGEVYEEETINLPEMSLKCYSKEIDLIHSKLGMDEIQTTRMLANAHYQSGMLLKKMLEIERSVDQFERALEATKKCYGEKSIQEATIADNLGMIHVSKSDYVLAKKYYSSAYSAYETAIGRDDLKTSDCAFRLGIVLEALESDLALDFYKESLRVRRLHIDDDDERVADTLFYIARLYLKRDDHQYAATCLEESLEIRKQLFDDCSVIADTYHNLGNAYSILSQGEKALIYFRESVRINKKVKNEGALYKASLGMAQCAASCMHYQLAIECYTECLQLTKSLDDTPDTALLLQKMGEIQLNELHNYVDAKKMLLDALELRRGVDVDGSDGNGMCNLLLLIAQASALAKDYNEALDFYEELVELLEASFPKNEQLLADALYTMGNILAAIDQSPDYELAIEKFNNCADIKRKIFGADSEEVANVVYALATVYEQAGCHEKAIESLSEALRSYKMNNEKGGAVKVYQALAKLKASKAIETHSAIDCAAAIECYREALRNRRQINSVDDIDLASILYEYASFLCANSDQETALPMLEEALQIQKSKCGLKNERVANILLCVAGVYIQQEKYDASLVSLEQVSLIHSSLYPDKSINDCIDMGLCYFLLGKTYRAQSEFHRAISSYSECLPLKQNKFGADSIECAVVHNELGEAYGKVNDWVKAIESLVAAIKIRKKELGGDSVDYAYSVFNLAKIHFHMDKHDQALSCLDETIRVFQLSNEDVNKTLAEVYELKGDTFYEVNQNESAASTFQECLNLFYSSTNDDECIARLNHKLGRALVKLGEFTEAFDSFHEAVRIFSDEIRKDDLRVGDVMYDLGLLIVDQGGLDATEKALACFNEVVHIYGTKDNGRAAKVADALVQKSPLLADFDESISSLNEAVNIYQESLGEDVAEIGYAMIMYGKLHEAQHLYDEAMAAFDEALRIFQIVFGEDDINVSISLSKIGNLHARKLEYSEAVYKCKRALKIRVSLGEQEQDIADSVFNIGNILKDWGKADEAVEYFQQALKLFVHLLGEEDVSVAKCEAKLGGIYCDRKDFDRSLSLLHHALRIYEDEHKKDDEHNTLIASLYQCIGNCYYNKGEYDKALENIAKCLQMLKMEYGDDSIEMAAPCDYAGLICQKKENYDEAVHFHSKALRIQEKFLGKESKECASSDFHIAQCLLGSHHYEECISRLRNHLGLFYEEYRDDEEVANVYHPLGLAQYELGEYEESIHSLNRVLDIRTKVHGECSLQVAAVLLEIAKVREESGDSDQAITLYDQAISLFRVLSNSDYCTVASAYSHLGALFEEKGEFESSLHSWKEALKIISSKSGNNSFEVAEILHRIGIVYDQLGDYDKSTKCLAECIKICRSRSEGDLIVAVSLGYISKSYMRKKQYALAAEVSTESLRLKKQHARAEEIAESLVVLGNILKDWGKPDHAILFFDEALRTFSEALGFDSLEVASCTHEIGLLRKSLREPDAALRCFGEALRVFRLKEGDKSLNVADNLFQIGQIYASLGDKDRSSKCFEECLRVRQQILGEDDDLVE